MPSQIRAALSAGVQTLISLLISWLAVHGVDLPASWKSVATTVLLAVVTAVYAALASWLANRTGTSFWAQAARLLSRIMTLGLGAIDLASLRDLATGEPRLAMTLDIDRIARQSYAAYGATTGGKTFDGRPMPAYDQLGDTIQRAWRSAARAALTGRQ